MKKFVLFILSLYINSLFATSRVDSLHILFQISPLESLLYQVQEKHEQEEYYDVINLVNSNFSLIKDNGPEWLEVFNSYKFSSQFEIKELALKAYIDQDYEEAEHIMSPIIQDVIECVERDECTVDCCLIWSSCVWLYGRINEKLNNVQYALSLLELNHKYSENNLTVFLSVENGGYTKETYASYWNDLALAYGRSKMYEESYNVELDVLNYCRQECEGFLYEALKSIVFAPKLMYSQEGTEVANGYCIELLDYLIDNSLVRVNVEDYLSFLDHLVGNSVASLYNYQEAIDYINKYLPYANPTNYTDSYDQFLSIKKWEAISYKRLKFTLQGSREASEHIWEEIINYYESTKFLRPQEYAQVLGDYANYFIEIDKDKSEKFYKDANEVWKTVPMQNSNMDYLLFLMDYLSFIDFYSNDNKIIEYLEDCLETFFDNNEKSVDPYYQIEYYRQQSDYYSLIQRQYLKADSLNSLALNICEDNRILIQNNPNIYARLLSDKFTYMANMGRWAEADSLYNKIIAFIDTQNNKQIYTAEIYASLSLYNYFLGNVKEYEKLVTNAIQSSIERGELYDLHGKLNLPLIVSLLRVVSPEERNRLGQYIIDNYDAEKWQYSKSYFDIYTALAYSFSELGDKERAEVEFQKEEQLILNCQSVIEPNEMNLVLADFYEKRSYHEAIKGNLSQSSSYMELSNKYTPYYQKSLFLSWLYSYMDDMANFESNIVLSLNGLREDVQSAFCFLTETERQEYLENSRVNMINEFAEFAVLMPKSKIGLQRVYDASLQYKGILLSTTREVRGIIQNSQNDSINKVYSELLYLKQIASNQDDTELFNIIKEKEKQVLDYIRNNQGYNDLDITWQDVQRSLKDDECAVEFLRYTKNKWVWAKNKEDQDDHYLALVITSDSDSPIFVDLFDQEILEEAVSKGSNLYRDSIASKWGSQIWDRIKAVKNGIETIYFSPIGFLNQLNIEALDDDGITYIRLSSTRELCKKDKSQIQNAILYGGLFYDGKNVIQSDELLITTNNDELNYSATDSITRGNYAYLPGTYIEVRSINRLLQNSNVKSDCITGNAGTIDSFRSLSGHSPSILHIATHAIWDNNKYGEENLRNGGLLFASSSWDDKKSIFEHPSFLYAQEISNMDLSKTTLAVLSACQTGTGKITDDGVWGIQRAFKLAGVQTIIMSLWQVDDTVTALLMTTFYKELLRTGFKHEAFKLAQKEIKEQFDNPYYWAGFIMLD